VFSSSLSAPDSPLADTVSASGSSLDSPTFSVADSRSADSRRRTPARAMGYSISYISRRRASISARSSSVSSWRTMFSSRVALREGRGYYSPPRGSHAHMVRGVSVQATPYAPRSWPSRRTIPPRYGHRWRVTPTNRHRGHMAATHLLTAWKGLGSSGRTSTGGTSGGAAPSSGFRAPIPNL